MADARDERIRLNSCELNLPRRILGTPTLSPNLIWTARLSGTKENT
jgi:hypothetical protein